MPTVALKITPDLLRMILHLPDGYHITGARMDTVVGPTGWLLDLLVLDVDAPDAPGGAVEMAPSYVRDPPNAPDPVTLHAVEWTHVDGTRTVRSVEPSPD